MTVSSVLKWGNNMKDKRFKIVFVIIISIGIIGSALNLNPLSVLLFAQALNGILLPVIAIMLLIIMNNKKFLGNYTNTLRANIFGRNCGTDLYGIRYLQHSGCDSIVS